MTAVTLITTTVIQTMTDIFAKMRHETKHQIGKHEDLVLSQRLGKLFKRDEFAGPDGTYKVTSLYFDTPYDDALREKLEGQLKREKFRLRYYGNEAETIRLEKKFKINGLSGKNQLNLTKDEVIKILNGEYSFLLDKNSQMAVEFYSKLQGRLLKPKTIVTYDREAFRYPAADVRITLDRNIKTSLHIVDFLSETVPKVSVAEEFTVLEVKYRHFIPDVVLMAIQTEGSLTTAFSKYAVCRRFD